MPCCLIRRGELCLYILVCTERRKRACPLPSDAESVRCAHSGQCREWSRSVERRDVGMSPGTREARDIDSVSLTCIVYGSVCHCPADSHSLGRARLSDCRQGCCGVHDGVIGDRCVCVVCAVSCVCVLCKVGCRAERVSTRGSRELI